MNNNIHLRLFFLSLGFFICLLFVHSVSKVLSAAGHIVISEVQIGGTVASDEFVELYNPTNASIDLAKWRLTRKTASGSTQSNLVASMSGTISPHGYFLIANPNYDGSVLPDLFYSATSSAISADNTVLLYSDAGVTVVDKVGMGTATDKEGNATVNPASEGSIERKPGENDPLGGNGEDTDDNSIDFMFRTISEPQNSGSPIEPVFVTPTVEPTATPTPTVAPTATPIPSPTPTAVPTVTPTPTPFPTVTPLPTETPVPTEEPTPTPTISLSPTPTPSVTFPPGLFKGFTIVCTVQYKQFHSAFFNLRVPFITCEF